MPCRHLGSVPLSRLSSILSASRLSGSCAACPAPFLQCLTCSEQYCTLHFPRHSKQKNHPIGKEKGRAALYCGNCGSEPAVQSAKDKKLLQKIIEEAQVVKQAGHVTIVEDKVKSTAVASTETSTPAPLSNLGNTCFMNATLQSLNSCFPSKITLPSPSKTLQVLLTTLHQMRTTKQKSVAPRELLSTLSTRYKKFSLFQQQDAHDFLRCLFNCIKEEHGKEGDPLAMMAGKMVSRVRCGRCRRVSDTEEPFLDISLSLNAENSIEESLSKLSLEDASIEQLFSAWSRACELKGSNGYHCEACSPSDPSIIQDATLTFKLLQLPEILIIHLQRFKTVLRATTTKKKKQTCFAMEVLKDHQCINYPAILKIPSTALQLSSNEEYEACYELVAFIEHDGTCTSSGHYTAVVKHNSSWSHTSDTRITALSESKVLDPARNQPYLLFYRRIRNNKMNL